MTTTNLSVLESIKSGENTLAEKMLEMKGQTILCLGEIETRNSQKLLTRFLRYFVQDGTREEELWEKVSDVTLARYLQAASAAGSGYFRSAQDIPVGLQSRLIVAGTMGTVSIKLPVDAKYNPEGKYSLTFDVANVDEHTNKIVRINLVKN